MKLGEGSPQKCRDAPHEDGRSLQASCGCSALLGVNQMRGPLERNFEQKKDRLLRKEPLGESQTREAGTHSRIRRIALNAKELVRSRRAGCF